MAATLPPYGSQIAALSTRLGGEPQITTLSVTVPGATFAASDPISTDPFFKGLIAASQYFTLLEPPSDTLYTIQIYECVMTVTNGIHPYCSANLASQDQTSNIWTNYTTLSDIEDFAAPLPAGQLVFPSNGANQLIGVQVTNALTSPIECTFSLVYGYNTPLSIPTVQTYVAPPLYTGEPLSTISVTADSEYFPDPSYIWANSVLFTDGNSANEGDTTWTVSAIPTGWMDGMILCIPELPIGTTGTMTDATTISLSNAFTENFSGGQAYGYWPALADGGTITVAAGNYYRPFNIPQIYTQSITFQGTRLTASTLDTVFDGRGGIGTGTQDFERLSYGKGYIHTMTPMTIQDIQFINCGGADGTGNGEAAIYVEDFYAEGTCTIVNCAFNHNENGIFVPSESAGGIATVLIVINGCSFGDFSPNGQSGDGLSHDFYLQNTSATVLNSFFYGSMANCMKCRSPSLTVQNCFVAHWQDRCIDFPNGGALSVSDSLFTSAARYGITPIANFVGYANENTDNALSNPQFTNVWCTTGRYNDAWWPAPAGVTFELTNCPVGFITGQDTSAPPNFSITGSGTLANTYNGVVLTNMITPSDVPSIYYPQNLLSFTPGILAYNTISLESVSLDTTSGTYVAGSAAGTIIGEIVLSPTVAELGLGLSTANSYAAICNNPNGYTATAYFEILMQQTNASGLALAFASASVPAGTYSLDLIVMAPYSVPQTATISVSIIGSVGTATGLGLYNSGTYSSANAISSDGSTIVGTAFDNNFNQYAVYWQSSTIHALPNVAGGASASATSLSSNGSVMVGTSYDDSFNPSPVYWDSSRDAHALSMPEGYTTGAAENCSSDGAIIVGYAVNSSAMSFPMQWSSGTATVLNTIEGGQGGEATCCSADGSIIAGLVVGTTGVTQAAYWNDGTLNLLSLPTPINDGTMAWSQVYGCSSDGSVFVGYGYDNNSIYYAIYWDSEQTPHVVASSSQNAKLVSCSSDGTVFTGSLGNNNAVVWTDTGQTANYLTTPLGGFGGQQAAGCTDTVIVGQADYNSTGGVEAVSWTI